MSIFLDIEHIGFGVGHLKHKTLEINGTHSHQGVKFYDDARNFNYNSRITIHRGAAPIIWLEGKVVNNLIWSIIEDSSDIHLKALLNGVNEDIERRTERTSPDKSGVSGGTSRK